MNAISETEQKSLSEIITNKIKEYQEAKEYFITNELPDQQKKCEEDLQILLEADNNLKNNKIDEIDETKLPKDITPEYICGYSNEERIKKYYTLITEMINQKQKLQNELDKEIKELKKLTKNQVLSLVEDIKKDFNEIKEKNIQYDKIIFLLKTDFQNKWIPAPLYSEPIIDKEIEIINEEIPENVLRITFGKTNYEKNNPVFIKSIIIDTNYEDNFEQKIPKDWTHIIDWKLTDEEYKNLCEKKFRFDISEKKRGKIKYKGKCIIDLSKLKNRNDFSENANLLLESKRVGQTVEISFKIRKCQEPIIETYKRTKSYFDKFYPAFR